MKNTKAFQTALQQTMEELDRLGVSEVGRISVGDTIERNITAVAQQLGVQVRTAWNYFDPKDFAQAIAKKVAAAKSGGELQQGQPPFPPYGNPELALIMHDALDRLSGSGDLFTVLLQVALNSWMAGHIHGEDGCDGCARGTETPGSHDWEARMRSIRAASPDIERWLMPEVWNDALKHTGYSLQPKS